MTEEKTFIVTIKGKETILRAKSCYLAKMKLLQELGLEKMSVEGKIIGSSSKPSIVQVFNGQIAEMKNNGLTLQAIGNKVGVSRERVRQVLQSHYKDAIQKRFTLREVADQINREPRDLISFIRKNHFIPISGNRPWLQFTQEDINRLLLLIAEKEKPRFCKNCGKELLPTQHTHCSNKCSSATSRANWTEEQRAQHKANVKRWHDSHPKEIREMSRRAGKKAWLRHKEKRLKTKNCNYEVTKECNLPVGATFKATGFERPYIISEKGDRILLGCVKNLGKTPSV